jgi:transcriptional regulator with XRE-family HTH domain
MITRGQRIRRERERRRLSREELAKATGVALRTIGRIEKDDSPGSPNIAVLENWLGLGEQSTSEADDADGTDWERVLREIDDVTFWNEATRRAIRNAAHARLPLPTEDLDFFTEDAPRDGLIKIDDPTERKA